MSGLLPYYSQPDRCWSDARAAINAANVERLPIYILQPTVVYVFAVNAQGSETFAELPVPELRPAHFGYVEVMGWQPAPPDACTEQLWTDGYLALWLCEN